MKTPSHPYDLPKLRSVGAFTLMETVIAIGVLAVLLTGFMAVFTPAAQGIRRSISSEQAARLTTTLENELATLRESQKATLLPAGTNGFDKSFGWIRSGNVAANAIFVYQYRGNPAVIRGDGTLEPMVGISGEPGKDYIVQSMVRRVGEKENGKDLLEEDLNAIEGSVFFVKPTQLVFFAGELIPNKPGMIHNSSNGQPADDAAAYKEAVIAFSAEFHSMPTKSLSYLNSDEFKHPTKGKFYTSKPIFTRNLAVRR